MSTWNKAAFVSVAAVASAYSQNVQLDQRSTMHITFPDQSPLAVVKADWGDSKATPRGGAVMLDLRTSLVLRNISQARIRGVTLLVQAQEVTPGGKASVSVPSLDVGPGEAFPVKVDLRLLRPFDAGNGPWVEIGLDGVLFQDLSFFGPNKLNSRRVMTTWELEAQRDRQYLRAVLDRDQNQLKQELQDTLARLSDRGVDVQMARGRSTNLTSQQTRQVAFLEIPNSPVEPVAGQAMVSGGEAWSPAFSVRNRTNSAVKHVEMGWFLTDNRGKEVFAGSIPADVELGPKGSGRINQDRLLRLTSHDGQPVTIENLTAYVNQVEFADGRLWIPGRDALSRRNLRASLPPSPEEQRLAEIYRKKGLQAVIEELRKF